MNKYRTKYCAKITDKDIEKEVRVAGWIENIRDHFSFCLLWSWPFYDIQESPGIQPI